MIHEQAFKIGLRLYAQKHMPGVTKIGKVEVSQPVTDEELDLFVQTSLSVLAEKIPNAIRNPESEVRFI